MPEQRVLVLGANGQLGKALRAEFPQAVIYSREDCDLVNIDQVDQLPIDQFDVLINAAAYTAVDLAETTEGAALAEAVNASAVQALSHAATEHGILLVHVSTDYVFDGTKNTPYLETDQFNPLGVYAKTKAQGDLSVMLVPQHYILRTSWVIGDGNNFVRTMASLAERGIKPSVVNDQIGRLTFTKDLAAAIRHLINSQSPFGTYNLSNEGPASSWADIASRVYELTGHNPADVTGVTTEEYFAEKEGIAPRPLWSMLDLSKIEATGFIPASWEARLQEYLA
ncbi:dTDP-4-dehydrorhamnose reductase [Aurantimicrobium minutum]|uniref:dTDP-4-dehydrorhamnose reductase n=1 Tax=Aurantimicrobium minutum TaxID=708131 RepID=UPI0024740C33|nr:dTDP-4-dehydrorhamnose reductase [Aurantimicrobium minutum]MDH6423790.1 dTDP-4-dehydrorhamnose reductase [Aurantimicrobium minutum]